MAKVSEEFPLVAPKSIEVGDRDINILYPLLIGPVFICDLLPNKTQLSLSYTV